MGGWGPAPPLNFSVGEKTVVPIMRVDLTKPNGFFLGRWVARFFSDPRATQKKFLRLFVLLLYVVSQKVVGKLK